MALVNHANREINAKIVLCGPAAAGKATLMKAICSKLPLDSRGPLRSMALQQDRMLFFDFTHPEGGDPERYSVRFHVYTLTGAVTQDHAWKIVLKGVDGIAFVADSDPARQDVNRQVFFQMQAALSSYGKSFEDVATVVFCTKPDLATAMLPEQILQRMSEDSFSALPVVGTSGEGVLEALGLIVDRILTNHEELGLLLQPTVRMLREFVPQRHIAEKPEIAVQPVLEDDLPSAKAVDTADERPLITFAGPAATSSDGVLRVPIKVSFCERQAEVILNISLQSEN